MAASQQRSYRLGMGVRIGTGLSTLSDVRFAASSAAAAALHGLCGRDCDVAVVFASGAHLAAPMATLEGVHDVLEPDQLIGCGAAGVIGQSREIEGDTAVVVWAAALDGGEATAFHATAEIWDDDEEITGLIDFDGAAGALLLADPFTIPTDALLEKLSAMHPRLPLLGGLASARSPDAETPLFLGDRVVGSGAVGLRFDGVEIIPWVSHGAVPVGPELTITAAEGRVVREIAGTPALLKLREAVEALPEDDLRLVRDGLLIGIVVDRNKPEYVPGDFLVRALVGADPATNEVTIGSNVRPGQVMRLHVRDAASADRDLRDALNVRMTALGGRSAAGALLIACNGRGTRLFGREDHDAKALNDQLHGAPIAGFFAAGEIGPGGSGSFLHSLTATVAVFV
jgi:small ligand-binding sensory domain FIST